MPSSPSLQAWRSSELTYLFQAEVRIDPFQTEVRTYPKIQATKVRTWARRAARTFAMPAVPVE
jgi:hypothetical protein